MLEIKYPDSAPFFIVSFSDVTPCGSMFENYVVVRSQDAIGHVLTEVPNGKVMQVTGLQDITEKLRPMAGLN